jgi:outer membrane protein OmpA-like peptidoglycan-associated protein
MTNVTRDSVSYRRGLVLGLTMAEIMLLLVFCLLIALAALISQGRLKLEEAERRIAELNRLVDGNAAVAAQLEAVGALQEKAAAEMPSASPAQVSEAWTRLVADAGIVKRLRDTGVEPAALVEERDVAVDLAIADAVRAETVALPDDPEAAARAVRQEFAEARTAERRAAALEQDVAALEARAGKPADLPPIITLREDKGYYFETGSAVLPAAAAAKLHDETAVDLARLVERYDVDVIEVIGHTDERRVAAAGTSNLDETLLDAVNGGPIEALAAADNAGLGLARAVSVAQVLKSDRRLAGTVILPLSAAQLIRPDGTLTAGGGGDEPARRRIEIRLRRSNSTAAPAEAAPPDAG